MIQTEKVPTYRLLLPVLIIFYTDIHIIALKSENVNLEKRNSPDYGGRAGKYMGQSISPPGFYFQWFSVGSIAEKYSLAFSGGNCSFDICPTRKSVSSSMEE